MIRRTFKYRFNLNQFSNKNVYWVCDRFKDFKYVTEENFQFHDVTMIDKGTDFFTSKKKFKKNSIKHTWRRLNRGDIKNIGFLKYVIKTFPNSVDLKLFEIQLNELITFHKFLAHEKNRMADASYGYSKSAVKEFENYYKSFVLKEWKQTKSIHKQEKEAAELRKKRQRKTKACIRHS